MQENTESDHFENRFPIDFLAQNQLIVRKSGQSHQCQFRTLFHQEELIIKKAGKDKQNHFEIISNLFLDPTLICSENIRLIALILVSDSFSSRGTHNQEYWRTISRIILKPFPIDFSSQNQFIVSKSGQSHHFQFRSLFHQEEPMKNGQKGFELVLICVSTYARD